MGQMGDGGYRSLPGPLGWGYRVVAWRAVRANMLCVAFYIRFWGGCTVRYAGLGRGWVWRWRGLHWIGTLNFLQSATQNLAVQNMFLNGLPEHDGKCIIWFARVDRRCPFWRAWFRWGCVCGSLEPGAPYCTAWTCGQICVGSFPKHFNLRSVMGPWCLC